MARRDAFGTFRAGVPHFSCRCSGGIPAGMGALEFCVDNPGKGQENER